MLPKSKRTNRSSGPRHRSIPPLDARNPLKPDAVVDRMCASLRAFPFKIPLLARCDGEVLDGHLRLKAARQLGVAEVPVTLCDEWSPAQVKAFRLPVNRSATWAELLSLELSELAVPWPAENV